MRDFFKGIFRLEIALFLVLNSALAGATILWLRLDRQPPWWDDSFYLTKSLVAFDALVNAGLPGYAKAFFSITPNRPPLIVLLPTPIYLLLGRNPSLAFGVNILLIPVLLGSIYLLGRKFWSGRAGLLAAAITATLPLIYGLARWYLVEFSLTAFVALAVLLLFESNGFERPRQTLGFGIVCALGLLLKVTFPLFILFPFIHTVFRHRAPDETVAHSAPSSVRKKIMLLALPSLMLAAPWYLFNSRSAASLVLFAGFSPDADTYGTGYVFSFSAVKTYLLELAGSGTSYYFALLAIALLALIVAARHTRAFFRALGREPLIILMLWGLPFLVFLFGRNKNLRYVAPVLPVFALALGFVLDYAARILRKGQALAICFLLIFPALSFLQKSFNTLGERSPRLNQFLCVNGPADIARKYETARWPQDEILGALARQRRFEPGESKLVMLGTDRAYFNADNFQLAAERARLPFQVASYAHAADLGLLLRSVDSATFFIAKTGGENESPYYGGHQEAVIQEVQGSGRFVELPERWPLPDGGTAVAYENLTPAWSLSKGAYIPAGLETIPRCEVNFGNRIELTGLSVTQTKNVLRVRFRWMCLSPPRREFWCFVHVLDARGRVMANLDHPILGGVPPINSWRTGDAAIEEMQAPLASQAAGAPARLLFGFYDVPTGERLSVVSISFPVGDSSVSDDGTAVVVEAGRQKAVGSRR